MATPFPSLRQTFGFMPSNAAGAMEMPQRGSIPAFTHVSEIVRARRLIIAVQGKQGTLALAVVFAIPTLRKAAHAVFLCFYSACPCKA